MMDGPTERVVDKAIKIGAVFAEVRSAYRDQLDIDTF